MTRQRKMRTQPQLVDSREVVSDDRGEIVTHNWLITESMPALIQRDDTTITRARGASRSKGHSSCVSATCE